MNNNKDAQGPIAWMVQHPVAANLLMVVFLVGGFFALQTVQQEVFPDVTEDIVLVRVAYPGASPEEVEQGIILAIEEAVRGIDGIYQVRSRAYEGMAVVEVEILEGQNLQKLAQDVQNEIDRIVTFPLDAEEPQVSIMSRKLEVLSIVLYGDAPYTALHHLGELAREQFLQDVDITQVEISGLPPLEISIEIDQNTLRRYGLTLSEVASRLSRFSVEIPAGGIKTSSGEILVRAKERRDYGKEFGRIPIINLPDGNHILLEDIAQIRDEFAETDQKGFYNGKPAIMVNVYRIGKQTPLQVEAAALRQLEAIKPSLPPGIGMEVVRNMADVYRQRISLLLRNAMIGLVLVFLSLGLFLELRLAFWVMLGIPVSFLGSFLFLPVWDVSINMISMFAYIIALGIVVDDAIVIGENIYYHHQQGKSFAKAAIIGAKEMAVPVTYSILTNIATFAPLLFIPGVMGKIFKVVPAVVCTVFIISLVESLFILPSHLSHQKEMPISGLRGVLHRVQQSIGRGFTWGVENIFGPTLDLALRVRYLVGSASVAIFIIVVAYALSGRMGFGFFPVIESDFARVEVTLPFGAAVQNTEAVMNQVYEGARRVVQECGHAELVKGIYTEIGRSGSHTGVMMVYLADPEVREKIMSTAEFVKRWREAVGPLVGIDKINFAADAGGPGAGAALTVELSHRNINILEDAALELAKALSEYPMCRDIDSGFQAGKQQINFTVNAIGRSLGFTAQSIARNVRDSFYGAEVVRQQRSRNEIKVMVRLPKAQRISEEHLQDMILRTPKGGEVPLREVIDMKRGRAYTVINRRDGRRVIQVSADVSPRDKVTEITTALQERELPTLTEKYSGLTWTFEGRQADMRESIASLRMGFILALFVVYALLAIPFRSYSQPLIIMVSIPFGVIGAILGHMLIGISLSVISLMGVVALSGVVVNDALVLIEAINKRRREQQMASFEAVHTAAIQRFRPIFLTTLTTFCGLTPMIFEKSFQAQMMVPMAVSLGFGIVFATLITLFLIPSLYLVLEDLKYLVNRRAPS